MSLCKRVDWCPYCSSWSAGTGKSETYRASELSRTMTGHASVARQCLLPEETQARRVELEMPVMVLVRVPASPLQLLVAFVTYHSPPKRQNPPVTVVSLVLTLAAHRLSLSRSAPAFFTISTRDPRWPEQAGSLRSSLVTPFLVLPPVAGRRVLVLLALSQLLSASFPPPRRHPLCLAPAQPQCCTRVARPGPRGAASFSKNTHLAVSAVAHGILCP